MAIIVFQGLLFFLYSVLLSWNAFIVRVGFGSHGQSVAIGHIQVWSILQSVNNVWPNGNIDERKLLYIKNDLPRTASRGQCQEPTPKGNS